MEGLYAIRTQGKLNRSLNTEIFLALISPLDQLRNRTCIHQELEFLLTSLIFSVYFSDLVYYISYFPFCLEESTEV